MSHNANSQGGSNDCNHINQRIKRKPLAEEPCAASLYSGTSLNLESDEPKTNKKDEHFIIITLGLGLYIYMIRNEARRKKKENLD